MAGKSGMWFDVGVRDTQAVNAIKGLMDQLEKAGESTDNLVKYTNQLIDALNKIRRMKNSVMEAMGNAKANGESVKPWREQLKWLEMYEKKLRQLKAEDLSSGRGGFLVGNTLGADYKERLRVIGDLLSGQRKMAKAREENSRVAQRESSIELTNTNKIIRAQMQLMAIRNKIQKAAGNPNNAMVKELNRKIGELSAIKNSKDILNNSVVGKALGWEYTKLMNDARDSLRQYSVEGKQVIQTQKELNSALLGSNDAFKNQISVLGDARNLLIGYFSIQGAKQFLQQLVEIGGAFEMQHMALKNILGDGVKANEVFSQLKALAIESPMSFRDLATDAKMLSAYSIPADELFDTTKRLADLSAGLGVGMDRLILAYGQVRSATVLRGQELRQFTEAGVPLVDALAKKLSEREGRTVTSAEVLNSRIRNKEVGFDLVKEVIEDMTNEGGKFYNMQLNLSNTLLGRYMKLKDAWEITLSEIASGTSSTGQMLSGMLNGVMKLIQGINYMLPAFIGAATGLFSKLALGGSINKVWYGGGALGEYKAARYDQRRRLMYEYKTRKMNREEIAILNNSREMQTSEWMLLASQKKLTSGDIRRLYLKGQITKATLAELAANNLIARKEAARLQNMTYWQRKKELWGARGKEFLTGLGSFFMNPAVIFSTVAGLATSIYTAFDNAKQKIESAVNNMRQSNMQKYNSGSEALNSLGNISKPTEDDFKRLMEVAKEVLPDYGNVMKSLEGTEDLSKAFTYLKTEVEHATDALKKLSSTDFDEVLKGMRKAAGGFFENMSNGFREDFSTNMTDYDKSVAKFGEMFSTAWSRYGIEYKKVFDRFKQNHPEFGNQSNVQILYDVLQKNAEGNNALWNELRESASLIKNYYGRTQFQNLGFYYNQNVNSQWKPLNDATIDAYDAFKKYMKTRSETTTDEELEQWAEKNKSIVKAEIASWVDSYEEGSKEVKTRVKNVLSDLILHQKVFVEFEVQEITKSDLAAALWESAAPHLTVVDKNGKNSDKPTFVTKGGVALSEEEVARYYAGDFFEAQKNLAQSYQNEIDRQKSIEEAIAAQSDKTGKTYKDLQNQLQKSKDASKFKLDLYQTGFGGHPDDITKGKYGAGGDHGDKTDKALKDAQKNAQQIEKVKSLYKNLLANNSVEEALDKVRRSGMSYAGLLDSDVATKEAFDAWQKKMYGQLLNSIDGSTEERQAARDEWLLKMLTFDTDRLKKELDDLGRELQKAIKDGTSNWNLFKSIRDTFGDEGMASQLVYGYHGGGAKVSDVIASNIGYGLEKMGSKRTLDELRTMSESELKDVLGENSPLVGLVRDFNNALNDEAMTAKNELVGILKDAQNAADKLRAAQAKAKSDIEKVDVAVANGEITPEHGTITKRRIESNLADQVFKASPDYLRFFNAVTTMTLKAAEDIGVKIRENLDERMRAGTLSAKEYYDEIERIEKQLDKIRDSKSDFATYLSGGLDEVIKKSTEDKMDEYRSHTINQKDYLNQSDQSFLQGDFQSAEKFKALADGEAAAGAEALKGAQSMQGFGRALKMVEIIVKAVDRSVQSFAEGINSLADAMEANGIDTSAGTDMGDLKAFANGASEFSSEVSKSFESFKNGDPVGAVTHGITSFTSIWKNAAKYHDAKLQRQIELAEEQKHIMENIKDALENSLERTLGGIYEMKMTKYQDIQLRELRANNYSDGKISFYHPSSQDVYDLSRNQAGTASAVYYTANEAIKQDSYYLAQYALLQGQLQKAISQRDDYADQKNVNDSKLSDYKNAVEELKLQVRDFAQDMAKTLYDIDVKSWAGQLGDALYDAWKKGTDAMDAYKEKLGELIMNTAKNIIVTRIIEKAMSGPVDALVKMMDEKNGKLTEDDVANWATSFLESLEQVTGTTINALDAVDAANQRNLGYSAKEQGSASGGKTIGGITEDQADVLISYINGMRADLSVEVSDLKRLMNEMMPNMVGIFERQLAQLKAIETNTRRSADGVEKINGTLDSIVNGIKSLKVR